MKYFLPAYELHRPITAFLLTLVFICHSVAQTAPAVRQSGSLSAAETELTERITVQNIKEMTAALSAPEMEGRGTGQPGGERAANWIADKYKSFGLKGLGDKGSYLQKVEFKETTATAETAFAAGDQPLIHGSDFAFIPQNNGNKNSSGDMVFVSYAIQSKEAGIDMLEGVNLDGKVVVMIEGPPPGFPEKSWKDQKIQMALLVNLIRSGAAAIVFIGRGDEKSPPEETISYLSRRHLTMPDEQGYPPQVPPLVYVSAKGAEKLFAKSGVTREQAIQRSASRDFKPVDLKQKAKIIAKYDVKKVTGFNVVGVLEGSDPQLKSEAVLFSAHYDAYGKDGGKIYYGAADNALGTSEMLAVAEAYSKSPQKPKRSIIFAAVTGEEYGLYGSKHWAKNPTWDIKKVAANLNLDGVGTEVYGPVKTMVGYGAEHSTLGTVLETVAGALDVTVIPDPMPDERIFYRSDHYSFVERGVPAIKVLGAPAGDKDLWMKRMKDWQKTDYHQPGDTIQPNWAWEGPERMARVLAVIGVRVANEPAMPSWLPSSRFAKLERGNSKEIPDEN